MSTLLNIYFGWIKNKKNQSLLLEKEPGQFSFLLFRSLDVRQWRPLASPSSVNLRFGDRGSVVKDLAHSANPVGMLRVLLRGKAQFLQNPPAVEQTRLVRDMLVWNRLLSVDNLASYSIQPLDLYLGEEVTV